MSRWSAEALAEGSGELERRVWTPGEPLLLRAVPGADAVQVRLLDGERPVRLFEVAAPSGALISLVLDASGVPSSNSPGARILRLPPETRAVRPRRSSGAAALDVVVIIDATRLYLQAPDDAPPVAVPRLGAPESWAAEHHGLMDRMIELFGDGGDGRFAVLAFGDQKAPFPVAEDLRPSFLLEPAPADRRFEPFSVARSRLLLEALRPSAGGDAVDAVAEALLAAAELPWRPDARRLALLFGDSPGYSIEDPPPTGAACFARSDTLESATVRLFDQQVDVATFFAPPAPELVAADTWRDLLHYAERQYRRLASLPDWASRLGADGLADFELPRTLAQPPDWLGRGPTLGFFARGEP